MTYVTFGARPANISSKLGDRWSTLISFNESGVPKKACHIHKSNDATASKIIVGFPLLPAYEL